MTHTRKRFTSVSGWTIEVTHSASDPCIWIMNRYKKFLGIRTHRSSIWFMNEEQALQYARGEEGRLFPQTGSTP